MYVDRVLSGMRPTGALHLGHYHGVLKNWVRLQHEYECLFFVADWHALTTHYDSPQIIEQNTFDMAIDWLAERATPASPPKRSPPGARSRRRHSRHNGSTAITFSCTTIVTRS
mgnify:CR=1 FL=1